MHWYSRRPRLWRVLRQIRQVDQSVTCQHSSSNHKRRPSSSPVENCPRKSKAVKCAHLLSKWRIGTDVHHRFQFAAAVADFGIRHAAAVADFGIRHAVRDPNGITQLRLAFTQGWMCPTDAQDPIASSFDIFPLGCLYAFTASNGIHAFGVDYVSRISNKQPMTLALTQLDGSVRSVSFLDLIGRMLNFEAKERPSVSDVLAHSIFNQPPLLIGSSQQTEVRIDHLISRSSTLAFNEPMTSISTTSTNPLEMSTHIEHLANR